MSDGKSDASAALRGPLHLEISEQMNLDELVHPFALKSLTPVDSVSNSPARGSCSIYACTLHLNLHIFSFPLYKISSFVHKKLQSRFTGANDLSK